MGEVKLISAGLFEAAANRAAASPRRRTNYNFHDGAGDNPHRFLNVLLRGTYISRIDTPRLRNPRRFWLLEGEAEVVLFDDGGAITARHPLESRLRKGACGASISRRASGIRCWRGRIA